MMSWFVWITAIITIKSVSGYIVQLTGGENIVSGATAYFKAELFQDNGSPATGEYQFSWEDNAFPSHRTTFVNKSNVAYWNVTYGPEFSPGQYRVQVVVSRDLVIVWQQIAREAKDFNITSFLNGELRLNQGKAIRRKYISNTSPVHHQIALTNTDADFINRTKNIVRSYWFVDCVYYGVQNGLQFDYNYTESDVSHYIETVVVGSFEPVVPTTTPQPTTVKPNVTTTSTTLSTTTTTANSTDTNEVSEIAGLDGPFKKWLLNFTKNNKTNTLKTSSYCINTSSIPINRNDSYGYFRTNLSVRAPIMVAPINGTNWLMDGEILNISLSCNGSSPYLYCVRLKYGLYNVTGEETCSHEEEKPLRNCSFGYQHLFKEPSEYTLVVIISNSVSRVVKPIAINIYKVTKHAQLSVIIVPVTFSIVAIILIIFGVAYYVQSKRSYTIEVADFDFGNQSSDMEYKTFRERLRESVSNSFLKSQDLNDNDAVWSPSRKYGSMQ